MKYAVQSKLKYNGKTYNKGDEVEMSKEEAESNGLLNTVLMDPKDVEKEEAPEVDSDLVSNKSVKDVKMNVERLPNEPGHKEDKPVEAKDVKGKK